MKPPKCRLCESHHWSNEPHKFAINTDKRAINTVEVAINTAINTDDISGSVSTQRIARSGRSGKDKVGTSEGLAGCADQSDVSKAPKVGCPGNPERSPNRRSKEAYNTYMREYMRKRRGLA